MEKTNVEVLYEWIDQMNGLIQQYADEPYLDRLIMAMEILLNQKPYEEMDELLSKKIDQALGELNLSDFQSEEIRKSLQLAILKGMKEATQDQHLMTPDTVALLVGYIANKLTEEKELLRMFDTVSGTGNLLTAVTEHMTYETQTTRRSR